MTSPTDIHALIAEIDQVLTGVNAKAGEVNPQQVHQQQLHQQQRVLAKIRQFLLFSQPSEGNAPNPVQMGRVGGEETAEAIAQAVMRQMNQQRHQWIEPLQMELETLRQQREALLHEIRKLESQRQQITGDFVQVLLARCSEGLQQQMARSLESFTHQLLPLLQENPQNAALPPNLNPNPLQQLERLEQLRELQRQFDQLLMSWDATVRRVFQTLEQDLQAYRYSLGENIADLHNLGEQSVNLFQDYLEQLTPALGTPLSLPSSSDPAPALPEAPETPTAELSLENALYPFAGVEIPLERHHFDILDRSEAAKVPDTLAAILDLDLSDTEANQVLQIAPTEPTPETTATPQAGEMWEAWDEQLFGSNSDLFTTETPPPESDLVLTPEESLPPTPELVFFEGISPDQPLETALFGELEDPATGLKDSSGLVLRGDVTLETLLFEEVLTLPAPATPAELSPAEDKFGENREEEDEEIVTTASLTLLLDQVSDLVVRSPEQAEEIEQNIDEFHNPEQEELLVSEEETSVLPHPVLDEVLGEETLQHLNEDLVSFEQSPVVATPEEKIAPAVVPDEEVAPTQVEPTEELETTTESTRVELTEELETTTESTRVELTEELETTTEPTRVEPTEELETTTESVPDQEVESPEAVTSVPPSLEIVLDEEEAEEGVVAVAPPENLSGVVVIQSLSDLLLQEAEDEVEVVEIEEKEEEEPDEVFVSRDMWDSDDTASSPPNSNPAFARPLAMNDGGEGDIWGEPEVAQGSSVSPAEEVVPVPETELAAPVDELVESPVEEVLEEEEVLLTAPVDELVESPVEEVLEEEEVLLTAPVDELVESPVEEVLEEEEVLLAAPVDELVESPVEEVLEEEEVLLTAPVDELVESPVEEVLEEEEVLLAAPVDELVESPVEEVLEEEEVLLAAPVDELVESPVEEVLEEEEVLLTAPVDELVESPVEEVLEEEEVLLAAPVDELVESPIEEVLAQEETVEPTVEEWETSSPEAENPPGEVLLSFTPQETVEPTVEEWETSSPDEGNFEPERVLEQPHEDEMTHPLTLETPDEVSPSDGIHLSTENDLEPNVVDPESWPEDPNSSLLDLPTEEDWEELPMNGVATDPVVTFVDAGDFHPLDPLDPPEMVFEELPPIADLWDSPEESLDFEAEADLESEEDSDEVRIIHSITEITTDPWSEVTTPSPFKHHS